MNAIAANFTNFELRLIQCCYSNEFDVSPAALSNYSRLIVGSGELFSHRKSIKPLRALRPQDNSQPDRVCTSMRQGSRPHCLSHHELDSTRRSLARVFDMPI